MFGTKCQRLHTVIPTNLHWQENGELHPDDLERLRERLLADAGLNQSQQRDLEGWVVLKQQAAA